MTPILVSDWSGGRGAAGDDHEAVAAAGAAQGGAAGPRHARHRPRQAHRREDLRRSPHSGELEAD